MLASHWLRETESKRMKDREMLPTMLVSMRKVYKEKERERERERKKM